MCDTFNTHRLINHFFVEKKFVIKTVFMTEFVIFVYLHFIFSSKSTLWINTFNGHLIINLASMNCLTVL